MKFTSVILALSTVFVAIQAADSSSGSEVSTKGSSSSTESKSSTSESTSTKTKTHKSKDGANIAGVSGAGSLAAIAGLLLL
ncbi:hypothetical protein KGF56_002626 [Candida oxycetoniae]|uniref:Uncharacterized protein n=1 Tax=Candida oxycetoniae TaxID=497107 RepID=A0AAI9SXW3_9ASCO|nr:uncharacterized protein KGF56_002626 [Candida oxycetoniae]KAI3404581.1 hypothetical protein KGF56_002626 [Candida oxycetoniae]